MRGYPACWAREVRRIPRLSTSLKTMATFPWRGGGNPAYPPNGFSIVSCPESKKRRSSVARLSKKSLRRQNSSPCWIPSRVVVRPTEGDKPLPYIFNVAFFSEGHTCPPLASPAGDDRRALQVPPRGFYPAGAGRRGSLPYRKHGFRHFQQSRYALAKTRFKRSSSTRPMPLKNKRRAK